MRKQIKEKAEIVTSGACKDNKFKMALAKTKEYVVEITFFLSGISMLAPVVADKLKYLWLVISSLWK